MNPDGLFVDDLASDAGDDAPLVVLVHGTMDRHSSFARVRSRLMATCHVVSYDRRGYARSRGAPPPATGVEDHVADLEAVVAGRRCTLFGHSYGGTVVLAFASRHPELAGSVVAYEPTLAWLETWPTAYGPRQAPFGDTPPEKAAESFLRRMIGDERFENLPVGSREEAAKDGAALVSELTAIRNDPPPFDPKKIDVPCLIACGSHGARHHREGAALLVEQMPDASLVIVEDAAHDGHQSHPRQVAELILQAVQRAGATGTVGGAA